MMSSWARTMSGVTCWAPSRATGPTAAWVLSAATLPGSMNVNIAISSRRPPPRPPRPATGRQQQATDRHAPLRDAPSRRTLGGKTRMNDRAVARERCRLDDLVVPLDRKRFAALVHQDLEECEEILGVEARSRRGN